MGYFVFHRSTRVFCCLALSTLLFACKDDGLQSLEAEPTAIGGVRGRICDRGTGLWVTGATVTVSGEPALTTMTDADGAFELELQAGDYVLLVAAEGYEGRRVAVVEPGRVTDIGPSTCESETGAISGRICDPDTDEWQGGATVTLSLPTGDVTSTTNELGVFQFFDVPVGSRLLTVTYGETVRSFTVMVAASSNVVVGDTHCGPAPVCALEVSAGATGGDGLYSTTASSTVTFSAAGSSSDSWSPSELTYEWNLDGRPSGSTASLGGSGMTASMTLDLAGDYTVSILVQDPEGQMGEECTVTVRAIPAQDLWVEMFWTSDEEDMDLHLVVAGGAMESDNDCYYSNCTGCPGEWGCPNWGSSGSMDDPALDLDDISGTGPENINISSPAASTYTVYVHDYPGSEFFGRNPTTVRVYLEGSLVRTYVSSGNAATSGFGDGEGNSWKVCTIAIPSGVITDHWQLVD
jgi:hypothetical protein